MLNFISHSLRLPKPIFLLSCIIVTGLFILIGLSNHEEGRGYVMGVVKKVSSAAGVGSLEWSEEDAMREWELRRALQHEGTGARLQAFLDKARSGQPFTVATVGGSVSKGRGLVPPRSPRTPKNSHHNRDDGDESDGKTEDNIDLTEGLVSEETTESTAQDGESAHPIAPLAHLGASTLYSHQNLHVQVFDWLNETFPHPQNRYINGAQGGVGAAYFGWCFKEHIPEEVDLVLMETGINDLLEFDVVSQYEHLVRGVLELDSRPAIINIETFTTLFPSLVSSSTFHQDVLSFYDVPSISIRDVIVPRLLLDPEQQMPKWFRTGKDVAMGDAKVREWGGVAVDVMHISAIGHALAAGLVIRYIQEQIDRTTPYGLSALGRFAPSRKQILRILDVPATTLTGQFNPKKSDMRHAPVCRSHNSAILHGKVSSLVDDFQDGEFRGLVMAEGSFGWTPWAWKEKKYLIAREPGSTAIFDFVTSPPQEADVSNGDEAASALLLNEEFNVPDSEDEVPSKRRFAPLPLALRPGGVYNKDYKISSLKRPSARRHLSKPNARQSPQAGGSILIGYQRSAKLGLGSVWCWVDDDKDSGMRVDGWWKLDKRNMGMVKEIATGLGPGPHRLSCEVLSETLDPAGGTEFRMFAVMHD